MLALLKKIYYDFLVDGAVLERFEDVIMISYPDHTHYSISNKSFFKEETDTFLCKWINK
jgi:hypothetical protein